MTDHTVKALELDDASFVSTIIDENRPAVVDFWGDGCAPCKAIAPIIDELAGELAGRITVAKVKVVEAPEMAAKYRILGVPAVVFISDGEEKTRILGAVPKQKYLDTANAVFGEDERAQVISIASNAMRESIFEGDLAAVKRLVAETPGLLEISHEGEGTAIGTALLVQQNDIADYLRSAGAKINAYDLAALGEIDELGAAIDAEPDLLDKPGPMGFTLLQMAILTSQRAAAVRLIELGADVNQTGTGQAKVPPAVLAIGRSDLELLRALVEADAALDFVGSDGATLADLADQVGNSDIIEYLAKQGD
ncbi:MAG: thioredoxin domain-containing protein [Gammaproteobacteria bacterium]|nr:thioredoxin domain-containing protein [Gammaproteobacteria bacterium]